jgi:hypothetical protein
MGKAFALSPSRADAPWFADALDTIGEFGEASIGLVAWELDLPEDTLVPAWRQACEQGLIERSGRCPVTREAMYRVVPPATLPS